MTKPTLSGKSAWLISDGKAGSDSQVLGIAEALGLDHQTKNVTPRGLRRLLAPWVMPSPSEKIGEYGSYFAPPWPDVVIAGSRLSIPYLRAVRHATNGKIFSIVLLDPKMGNGVADVIWVPQHDRLRGDNVITSLTPPHRFSPDHLADLRKTIPDRIASLPRPRIMVSLGGSSRIYRYATDTIAKFSDALSSLAALGVSFLITPSRRTPHQLIDAAFRATQNSPCIIWQGTGENPYSNFLAHADAFVVTADSISMTSEACATGRPVYVFEPEGGSAKFRRFHEALYRYGATRPMPDKIGQLEDWTYDPLFSADEIAEKIQQHWYKFTQQSRI